MRTYLLPKDGAFYKANLHCHTTCSDGRLSPAQVKALYQTKGYSVIAFTDHDILLAHPELRDESFLPLHGYEMEVNDPMPPESAYHYHKTCHMCLIALEEDNLTQVCYHRTGYLFGNAPKYREQLQFDPALPDYHRIYSAEGITDMMQKGREGGFFVTYNHPNWSMEEACDYLGYHGMHAMEIVNYSCAYSGYTDDDNSSIYDTILRQGEQIYCIAADDNHNGKEDWGGGFTMIKAPCLEYRAVTSALEQGHFYASTGAEITELYLEGNQVHLHCAPARKISLHTELRCSDAIHAADSDHLLTEAVFTVNPENKYFRLTVEDDHGYKAFTNAYFTKDWF